MSATRHDDRPAYRGGVVRRARTIHVVRHGQTELNRLGRLQGSSDPPLNAQGEAQAARAAQQLTDVGVRSVVASPMVRARQTAEAVGRAAGVPAREDRRLRERAFGSLEGAEVEHLRRTDGALVKRLTEDERFVPTGGESRGTVARRVRRFIGALLSPGGEHDDDEGGVAVVVHGGWCDIATTIVLDGVEPRCPGLATGEVRKVLVTECADGAGKVMWVAERAR